SRLLEGIEDCRLCGLLRLPGLALSPLDGGLVRALHFCELRGGRSELLLELLACRALGLQCLLAGLAQGLTSRVALLGGGLGVGGRRGGGLVCCCVGHCWLLHRGG